MRNLVDRFLNLPVIVIPLACGMLMFVVFVSLGLVIGTVPVVQVIGISLLGGFFTFFAVAILLALLEVWEV